MHVKYTLNIIWTLEPYTRASIVIFFSVIIPLHLAPEAFYSLILVIKASSSLGRAGPPLIGGSAVGLLTPAVCQSVLEQDAAPSVFKHFPITYRTTLKKKSEKKFDCIGRNHKKENENRQEIIKCTCNECRVNKTF